MKKDGEFPQLTILNDLPQPAQPRLSTAQKYGSLFWLGISGLVVSLLLVGWFTIQLWTMRDVWRAIYTLHEVSLPVDQRLAAAEVLIKDPRVEPSQLQPMIFRPTLPDKARYLIAEKMDKAVTTQDAAAMLKMLAGTGPNSPPNWLRGHLARLAAVTIRQDNRFPAKAFEQLAADDDPVVSAWAAWALANSHDPAVKEMGLKKLNDKTAILPDLVAQLQNAVKSADPGSRATALYDAKIRMRTATEQNRSIFAGG